MLFQLNITLTEEDYLAFNTFHSFESKHGKKLIRKARISFVTAMLILIALIVLILGWTTFSKTYTIILGLFTILYVLLFRKIVNRNIKRQINRLKKSGKLPFDPVSTIEFYDDKMVEITASKRTEQNYDTIEQICMVKDSYILLYHNSVAAYILPIPQIKAQINQEGFLNFLSKKCDTVEYY